MLMLLQNFAAIIPLNKTCFKQYFSIYRGEIMDSNFYRIILNVLLKYIDEGIHVIDRDGKTVVYNDAMEKLEGLERKEVIGKKLLDVFPSLNENTSTLVSALEGEKPIIDRYQTYLNKAGYAITTLNSTIPLFDEDGIAGSLEISKDLSGLKSLYEKISMLQQELNKDGKPQVTNKRRMYTFSDLTGCSSEFLNAVSLAKGAALSSSTVLIYGETGSGKELFAQSIHSEGKRRYKPFIAQNCAAIPDGLLEGILFGTVRGSFTGAVNRPGLFEQANGGTLLLDEINSMDKNLQPKLLRVLQEGCIRRVGGLKDIPVDVRVIATTNMEPKKAVEEGFLRKDLYYRLSVVNINIPPLRERKDDIPLLVKHFISEFNGIFSKNIWYVSDEVEKAMLNYSWPGNVRELKNYIESAMNTASSDHILGREHFPVSAVSNFFGEQSKNRYTYNLQDGAGLNSSITSLEKKIISDKLKECHGNISKCARALKIKRQTLQHKLRKYNIQYLNND